MWAYLDDVTSLVAGATGAARERFASIVSAFPDLHVVLLRCRDRVAQAVSWAKAEQTDTWYEGDRRRQQRPPSFDAGLIEGLLQAIEDAERGWASFLGDTGVQALEIAYEDLAADPIAAGRSVLEHLDISTIGVELQVQTRRQFDDTNREWIAQFNAERD
jgi:LPS sulfotransferase NodH